MTEWDKRLARALEAMLAVGSTPSPSIVREIVREYASGVLSEWNNATSDEEDK